MALAPGHFTHGIESQGAGVGAVIFPARSAVLESYLILHRLKPVLLKTVGVKVGRVALARHFTLGIESRALE